MKIAIIPDTNALYTKQTPDLSKLNLKEYDKILKIIEDNSLQTQIKILIPELVLIEWIKHYQDDLKSEIDNLKTAKKNNSKTSMKLILILIILTLRNTQSNF